MSRLWALVFALIAVLDDTARLADNPNRLNVAVAAIHAGLIVAMLVCFRLETRKKQRATAEPGR